MTAHADLLVEVLQHHRREGHYRLHAFVVMPEHVHILLTPAQLPLERVMGFIKGGFSHRLGPTASIWQRGFTDHRIRNAQDFEAHRTYIHQNPVERKLCFFAEQYPYSSAYKGQTSATEAALQTQAGRHG